MTIITVRDGIMAVDSEVSRDDTIVGQMQKWRAVPEVHGDGFVAGFGSLPAFIRLLDDYSKTGTCEWDNTDPGLVHLQADGSVRIFRGLWYSYDADYYAEGFGSREARGAMKHGATAEQAVRVACALVDSCGGKVHVLTVKRSR